MMRWWEGAAIVERMLSGGARSLTSIDLRRNYIHSNQVKYHATMQAIVASTVPCALGVKLAFLSGQLRWDTGGAAKQLVAVADLMPRGLLAHVFAFLRVRRAVRV